MKDCLLELLSGYPKRPGLVKVLISLAGEKLINLPSSGFQKSICPQDLFFFAMPGHSIGRCKWRWGVLWGN